MIIIARFGVPPLAQDTVLYIEIVVSMVLRAVCIAAGAAAIAAFSWVFYVFGAFLVYTAVKLLLTGENDEEGSHEGADDPAGEAGAAAEPALRRHTARRTRAWPASIHAAGPGDHRDGIAAVVFTLDSIPAISGLTTHAYIVFTANAFALMGLRQLFFLVGGLLDRIVYLNIGLAVILGFLGTKLVVEALEGKHVEQLGAVPLPHIGILFSLAFIAVTLAVTTLASLARSGRNDPTAA